MKCLLLFLFLALTLSAQGQYGPGALPDSVHPNTENLTNLNVSGNLTVLGSVNSGSMVLSATGNGFGPTLSLYANGTGGQTYLVGSSLASDGVTAGKFFVYNQSTGHYEIIVNGDTGLQIPQGTLFLPNEIITNNFATTSTNTLAVTATGVTNATSNINYLLSITAGTGMTMKDGNGSGIFSPAINGCYPLKPGWRFTGTSVTALAIQQ